MRSLSFVIFAGALFGQGGGGSTYRQRGTDPFTCSATAGGKVWRLVSRS